MIDQMKSRCLRLREIAGEIEKLMDEARDLSNESSLCCRVVYKEANGEIHYLMYKPPKANHTNEDIGWGLK